MVTDNLQHGSTKEEDLYCIFNTIALFLDHHNFRKTYAVFKEECYSRNTNNKNVVHGEMARNIDEIKNYSKTDIIKTKDIHKSEEKMGITYTFEKNEPKVSLQEYIILKEKLMKLQAKQKELLHELEEKSRHLDRVISILQQKDMDQSPNGNIYEKTSSANFDKDNTSNVSLQIEEIANHSTDASITLTPKEDENETDKDKFIPISQERLPIEDVIKPEINMINSTTKTNFLFAAKKRLHIESAPSDQYRRDERNKIKYFSTPCSPKSHISNLNFENISHDLLHGNEKQKLLILQALYWKITKSATVNRRNIIKSYVQNDILNLNNGNGILTRAEMLNEDLEEALTKLINLLASLKEGRDYLSSSNLSRNFLITTFRKHMNRPDGITKILEMLIATMQKLSIRSAERTLLVQAGILDDISTILVWKRAQLSSPCLEYACALFMNLCLDGTARKDNAKNPSAIIGVFSRLLNSVENVHMPYICGALYSVLSEDSLRKEALKQRIDVLLHRQLKNTNDSFIIKQIEFIIRYRFKQEDSNLMLESEPDEELDLLETGFDQNTILPSIEHAEATLKMYELQNNDADGINTESEQSLNDTKVATLTEKVPMADSLRTTNRETFIEDFLSSYPNFSAYSLTVDNLDKYIDACSCLVSPMKYNCGCYEAIKKSIEEDDNVNTTVDLNQSRRILSGSKISEEESSLLDKS